MEMNFARGHGTAVTARTIAELTNVGYPTQCDGEYREVINAIHAREMRHFVRRIRSTEGVSGSIAGRGLAFDCSAVVAGTHPD